MASSLWTLTDLSDPYQLWEMLAGRITKSGARLLRPRDRRFEDKKKGAYRSRKRLGVVTEQKVVNRNGQARQGRTRGSSATQRDSAESSNLPQNCSAQVSCLYSTWELQKSPSPTWAPSPGAVCCSSLIMKAVAYTKVAAIPLLQSQNRSCLRVFEEEDLGRRCWQRPLPDYIMPKELWQQNKNRGHVLSLHDPALLFSY